MPRKIALAAFTLLATISTRATAAVEHEVSGPSTMPVRATVQYELTFNINGPTWPADPMYKLRSPSGVWSEGAASMTVTDPPGPNRTVSVTKSVMFTMAGSWHVYLKTYVWVSPPCNSKGCPDKFRTPHFGSKDVNAVGG